MKIVVHDRLMQPQTLDVSRIVIYDDLDNPVAYALEYGPRMIRLNMLQRENAAEFNRELHEMGIHKVVVAESLQLELPPPGARFG